MTRDIKHILIEDLSGYELKRIKGRVSEHVALYKEFIKYVNKDLSSIKELNKRRMCPNKFKVNVATYEDTTTFEDVINITVSMEKDNESTILYSLRFDHVSDIKPKITMYEILHLINILISNNEDVKLVKHKVFKKDNNIHAMLLKPVVI